MNLITDPLRALVRRKLWPVALLLVGALVAVPLALSKQPQADAVAATAPANAAKTEGLPATFVSEADTAFDSGAETGAVKRKRTLGASKDPFEPAPLPKAKKKKAKKSTKAKTAQAEPTATATPAASSGGGASTGTPVATATPAPTKTIPGGSLTVRFGDATADALKSRVLTKSTALPSSDDPAFVFDHLKNNGKVAVFMLTGAVTVEGDGKCLPTPENCQTLELKVGDTEFLTVTETAADATGSTGSSSAATPTSTQYELDLLKVHTKPFTVAAGDD